MGRKRKGKAVRKNAHKPGHGEEEDDLSRAPHSFVVPLGKASKCIKELVSDFRHVMEPFTATRIKPRPGNVVKDYVQIAGPLNVTHMIGFTKTELGPYIKIARFPRGPTLTFRVNEYVMARDVKSSLKRQITYDKQFLHHPLLIMNGFSGDARELQLTSSMFQNMFPSINVSKVKLNTIKRCVLLNRDEESGNIEFRHYTIKVVPTGLSKGMKKIATGKIPNLSKFEDMTEFLNSKGGMTSDSEGEEDETSKVLLPQAVSARGNLPQEQSAIRLVELGPRMTLKLIKIEEGLFDGDVMYHSLVQKTDEEAKAIRIAREKRKKEKEKRKKEQEINVKKKEVAKEEHKKKSLAGMKHLKGLEEVPKGFEGVRASQENNEDSEDDDEEWYRKEVGQAPDKDLFEKDRKRKGNFKDTRFKKKKPRLNSTENKRGDKFSSGNKRGSDKFSKPRFNSSENKRGGGDKFSSKKSDKSFNKRKPGASKPKFKVSLKSSKMRMKKKSNNRK